MTRTDKVLARFFTEIVLGLVLSFLSLFLFLYITFGVLTREAIYLDNFLLTSIYSFRDPILTNIMHFASFLGGELMLLSSVVIVVLLALKKHKKEAALFAFTVLAGYVLNNILKQLLKIPRPDIDPIAVSGSYSFPSGHGMNSFIFYGLLAYFTFHFTRNRRLSVLISIFSIVLIFLIGFSRLYLGLHYPSDVIGGFTLGFWWLTTGILIDKAWEFYKLFRHKTK